MDLRLHYELAGDPGRPAMLLIHGFLSSNLQWELNREFLSRHYYLVMVESFGHGQSPRPDAPQAYSAESYIEQFEKIRRELGIEKWFMLGQSFGAGLVINYALALPERVIGLIFTNSRSAIGQLLKEVKPTTEESFSDLRAMPMHPIHARRIEEGLKERLVAAADNVSARAAYLGTMVAPSLGCRDRMNDIQVPTLLCNGIYEKAFQADVEYLRQNSPGIEVADLPAGHSTNMDAPEEFNRAVHAFCEKLYQPRPSNTDSKIP